MAPRGSDQWTIFPRPRPPPTSIPIFGYTSPLSAPTHAPFALFSPIIAESLPQPIICHLSILLSFPSLPTDSSTPLPWVIGPLIPIGGPSKLYYRISHKLNINFHASTKTSRPSVVTMLLYSYRMTSLRKFIQVSEILRDIIIKKIDWIYKNREIATGPPHHSIQDYLSISFVILKHVRFKKTKQKVAFDRM